MDKDFYDSSDLRLLFHPDEEYWNEDYLNSKKNELHNILRDLGLKNSGNKPDLIQRLSSINIDPQILKEKVGIVSNEQQYTYVKPRWSCPQSVIKVNALVGNIKEIGPWLDAVGLNSEFFTHLVSKSNERQKLRVEQQTLGIINHSNNVN